MKNLTLTICLETTMKHTILRFGCLLLMGLSLQGCGFSESDLEKVLETNACQKCYFSGADLKGENLEGSNLKGADLSGKDLSGASLYRADLNKANLSGANLIGADLELANLFKANLTNTNLTKASLEIARNFNTADTTVFCRTIMPDGSENNSGC